ALGIQGIHYECYAWSAAQSEEHAQGAQVDLVIDRADRCVNLCEIKFCSSPFVLTREYAQRLREKRDLFIQVTGTRKTVFTTLITAFGAKENEYYLGAVDNQLSIDDLFLPDPKY
ncbi:MAG: ATP-binding protein, partial [Kiritimatiellae bacterium]|nr:ATP-binding protein [Kiritimatiellia bacterium]